MVAQAFRFLFSLVVCLLFLGSASGLHALKAAAPTTQPGEEITRVEVPEVLDYCGLILKFTPEARALVQQEVDKLMQNLFYHQVMVERADQYMPYIRTAFRDMGVPEDLVFIAIQESALKGDAVSKSNAVGFWQFKDFTAREVGLMVNGQVDERKHIYRASVGAALYFNKNYLRHRNWLYAVISYMTGGTGAIPFIDAQYKGAREMVVEADLHWYARKAIAHKLAYQPFLGKKPPKTWLEVSSTEGETNVQRLVQENELDMEEFRKHNLWVRSNQLPQERPFSYYYPTKPEKRPRITPPA
jgi:Soluble lytic murein transglycosylase and related regulatory proteins (some contain LysM/invasin domains)